MSSTRHPLLTRAWLFPLGYGFFAFAFHQIGNVNGLYFAYWWFQIAAHFLSATAMAVLLVRAGLEAGLRGRRLVAFVVGFSAIGALGWEYVEYLGLFANLHWWGIEDSLLDLAADTVGVGTVLYVLRTRFRPAIDPAVETPPMSTMLASDARPTESDHP